MRDTAFSVRSLRRACRRRLSATSVRESALAFALALGVAGAAFAWLVPPLPRAGLPVELLRFGRVGLPADVLSGGRVGRPLDLLAIGLVGLAACGDGDIARLTAKIERFRAGEDVDFSTDREDELGELYAAVDDLATSSRAREADLEATERYRRRLYDVTSARDLDDDEKVRRLLELGCERLDVESGLITRIDEESGRYEVETVAGSDFVEAGTVTDLTETFCRETVTSDDVLGIADTPDAGYEDDPAFEKWDIGCYIGGKIRVDDELYGTICFVDEDPRDVTFSGAERTYVDLIARWVSHVYERRARERELERQSTLLDSLFEQIPVSLYVKDSEGRHVRTSTPYLREEYPDDEEWFRGKTDEEIYPEELAAETHADDMAVIESGEPVVEKEEFDPADDEWLLTSKVPWRDDDGDVRGLIGLSQYITEQKEREHELRETTERLEATNRTLRRLYEITADREADFDEKVERVLDLGRERLGTDAGFLARIDRAADRFEVVTASGGDERLRPGAVAPLSETYCRKTIESGELLSVGDAPADERVDDVAYDRWDYDCYVGRSVYVEGDLYGTLCFVDRSARESQFTDEERTFVELATQWVGYELERSQREQRLQRYREYTDDMLDAIDDVFFVHDAEGNLLRWNETLTDVTGYADEEVGGMHGADFVREADRERTAAAIEAVFEEGQARLEAPLLASDGTTIPYEFAASRVELPDGEPRLVGIGRDISERKRREREFEGIVENTDNAVYIKDRDGRYQFVNRATADLFDLEPSAVVGRTDDELFDDVDTAEVRAVDERVLERGETVTVEDRNVIDGEEYVFLDNKFPHRDTDGEIVGIMGISRDITERKERERELRETNERLNAIVEASPDALVVLDADGAVELWNPAAEQIFGWTAEEVMGERPPFVPDDRLEEFEAYRQRLAAGQTLTGVETRRRTKDGELVDVGLSAAPLRDEHGDVVGVLGVLEDITERKAYERDLERTADLLNRAEEMADVGGWSLDVSGERPYRAEWTDKLYDIFELPRDAEPPTEDVFEYYHPEDRDRHEEAVNRAIETGEGWDQELRLVTAEGTERWVHNIGKTIEADGEIVEIRGSIQDVTERKETERQVREREQRLQRYREYTGDILDSIDDVFYVVGEDLQFQRWNRSLTEVTGYSDAEISSIHPLELVVDEDEETIGAAIQETFETGHARTEARVRTKDGAVVPYEFSASTLEDPDGNPVLVGVGRDVTDRKEKERQLQEHKEYTDDILDAIDDVFYVLDGDGELKRWNDSLVAVSGYSDAEISAMRGLELFAEADREAVTAAVAEAFETGDARVEAPLLTEGGESIPYEFAAVSLEDPDGNRVLAGIGRDVSERKARERELERTTELLEQAGRIARFGGWELDVTTDPPEMTWSDELYEIHGVPREETIDVETALEYYHPEDREYVNQRIRTAAETGEGYDMEVRALTETDEVRWVRAIGEAVRENGSVVSIRGSIQDITEQKERELALESLHETTRGLLATESERDAAALVVRAAADVLDVACIGVYLLDPESNRLEPVSTTERFDELCGDSTAVAPGEDSMLWNCFVTGTPTVFDDSTAGDGEGLFGPAVAGGLLVPLGDHGVFVVATTEPPIDDETRQLVETVVATTEAAFDRIDSEAALRDRDAELEAQNRRLRRHISINDIIRRIDQSLVRASTREEIERAVCDRLGEAEDVAFAWIGGADAAGEELEPRAWAGTGGEYLDAASFETDDAGSEPAATVARTGEAMVVSNVVDRLQTDPWAKRALAADFHSVVAVPLAFEDYFYGALTVFATEPDAFDDLEREVFAELGENIAHSINAVETQRALHADTLVELALGLDGADTLLGQVAGASDCRIEYEGLAAHSEDESRLFFSAHDCDPAAVEAALDDLVSVREYRLVDAGDADDPADAGALFEVTVEGSTMASLLVRHGGSPRSIRVTESETEVVVDVPTGTDVREFVEMLRGQYPSVELAGRRTVERETHTRQELVTSLLDGLTDRQREVLRTAFFAGFFEWPRTSTGEEVAEMLGVTQPTVNRHLRVGQQRLLAQLFDGEAGPGEDDTAASAGGDG